MRDVDRTYWCQTITVTYGQLQQLSYYSYIANVAIVELYNHILCKINWDQNWFLEFFTHFIQSFASYMFLLGQQQSSKLMCKAHPLLHCKSHSHNRGLATTDLNLAYTWPIKLRNSYFCQQFRNNWSSRCVKHHKMKAFYVYYRIWRSSWIQNSITTTCSFAWVYVQNLLNLMLSASTRQSK